MNFLCTPFFKRGPLSIPQLAWLRAIKTGNLEKVREYAEFYQSQSPVKNLVEVVFQSALTHQEDQKALSLLDALLSTQLKVPDESVFLFFKKALDNKNWGLLEKLSQSSWSIKTNSRCAWILLGEKSCPDSLAEKYLSHHPIDPFKNIPESAHQECGTTLLQTNGYNSSLSIWGVALRFASSRVLEILLEQSPGKNLTHDDCYGFNLRERPISMHVLHELDQRGVDLTEIMQLSKDLPKKDKIEMIRQILPELYKSWSDLKSYQNSLKENQELQDQTKPASSSLVKLSNRL